VRDLPPRFVDRISVKLIAILVVVFICIAAGRIISSL